MNTGNQPRFTDHPGHFPHWPDTVTLNHLAAQWLAPHGTVTNRSGWQDYRRTQYAVVEDPGPERRKSIYIVSVNHSKGTLSWALQHESDNPLKVNCPRKFTRLADIPPVSEWKATLWRDRVARNNNHQRLMGQLIRTLRTNGPHHDPRVVLHSGLIIQHTTGTYRGHPTDAYWHPITHDLAKLSPEDIDLDATLKLRDQT